MRRRARHELRHRLERLEGRRGDGVCICANPVRVAWKSTTVVEHECEDCGGELIVVRLNFGEDPTPAAKDRATATFQKVIGKATVPGSKVDLTKLSDEELADLHDAMTPPGEPKRAKRPAKARQPAKKPQPVRASRKKRRTASQEPPSRPASVPPRVPAAPKSEHTAEPPSETEPPSEPSGREWESQRSRGRGSLTRGIVERDF